MATTHLVARHCPAALGDELRDTLVDFWAGSHDFVLFKIVSPESSSRDPIAPPTSNAPYTYHSQILKRPSRLNILQRLLEILQLRVDLALGLLGALQRLRLKGLDGLDLPRDIDLLELEAVELLLDVGDDVLILELRAVGAEVDRLRLRGELLDFAARVVVALFEGREGVGCAAAEAELGA